MAKANGSKHRPPNAGGAVSETLVLARLVELGYDVSIPFGGKLRYDLIADDGHELIRIQVKTGRVHFSGIDFPCATFAAKTGVRSYLGEADVFLVYVAGTNEIYWVPVEDCPETATRMSLRVREPLTDYAPTGIPWAKDYVFAESAQARRLRLEAATRDTCTM